MDAKQGALGAVWAERRHMSASPLHRQPRPDHNEVLRARIAALAPQCRRYGAEMVYLKLRQAGDRVNHKRVERLHAPEKLRREICPAADVRSRFRHTWHVL